MERVTEEAAQRGQAENAKLEIEKDLDDLSANLFNQANTMGMSFEALAAITSTHAPVGYTRLLLRISCGSTLCQSYERTQGRGR